MKRLIPITIGLVIAGCQLPGDGYTSYTCTGEYQFEMKKMDGDKLQVIDAGVEFELSKVRSASGEKYSGGALIFHSKGNDAVFTDSRAVLHKSCSTTPNT